MEDKDKPASGTDKDALIKEAKAYLELCVRVDGSNREDGLDDLRKLAGDHWDDKDKRQRQLDRRPCLTINKLPTFLHQVTNDQRQNVPSIKVSPVDSHADVETAEVVQGWIRHTEYSSNADVAYDTAVNSAAAIGFGYFRLITDYCTPTSFDQDIRFRRIRNPFTVYLDPMSEEPDGSDQKRCMITSKMARVDFKREHPDAEASNEGFALGVGDQSNSDWLGEDFVRIAEYYRIEQTAATAVQLSNGETGWKDELLALPPGVTVKAERASFRPKTMLYKLTALDILESTEIKCQWIPVFPVYGDEIDLDGKVIRSGILRNAKDPSLMYDYWMTAATEEVAMRTRTPVIGAEGQFEGYEDDWEAANVRNIPYLEYKPTSLDGQLNPPPQRQPMIDIPNGVLTMAMHANDNIKATTGLFDSSLGALGNARSGVQERSQQRQGDMANFHFADNLNRTVRHVGRCLISMMPHYLDAPRLIRIMGEDDSIKPTMINQPGTKTVPQSQAPPGSNPQPVTDANGQPQIHPETGEMLVAINTILNDLTVGEYDVTVSAGPSYSTLRQEAVDSMIQLGKSWPKLMDVAGDKVVKAMDWPGAAEIADRIKATIPPQILAATDQEEGTQQPVVNTPKGPIPVDQAAQMLEEMDQQIQQMAQQLSEAKAGITKAQIDADSREKVAEINAIGKKDVAELTGLVQLLIARIPPPPSLGEVVDAHIATRPELGPGPDSGASGQPPAPQPGPGVAP
jgi:Phage P22-like portal protein